MEPPNFALCVWVEIEVTAGSAFRQIAVKGPISLADFSMSVYHILWICSQILVRVIRCTLKIMAIFALNYRKDLL